MFADSARIFIKSGKAETVMSVSGVSYMCQMAVPTAEDGGTAEILFLKWMKD